MPHLIGIDVGTSSTKTVLINAAGEVIFTLAPEYDFETPRPGWAECDPQNWWRAVLTAIRAMLEQSGVGADDIAGIGLTGQMHGMVLLDAQGEVLRPCIMWNDQRTGVQCAALTEKVGADKVLELTGNPVLPGFTAPKILWVRDNEPDVFAKTAKVLLPKDYIRYRLSGVYATEVSDASGTGLLNVRRRDWSDEMLAACGIPRSWMADVAESIEVTATVSEEAAALTGLRTGTPIVGGGGDQAAQAVGCGIVREGIVSATFGTSGVVFAHSEKYRAEPQGRLHAFCAAVPGQWHLMGVMLSAAGSYQWYRNQLAAHEQEEAKRQDVDVYRILDTQAASVAPGCEGLLFLPYLSGERTPYADPDARGVFFGLSLRHGRSHLVRAVLEGVTYGMKDSLELMRALGIVPAQVVASGGGAKSPLWRTLMADVFNVPIVTNNASEGAAYGAAILAGVGTGVYADVVSACERTLKVTSETTPENPGVYADFYPHYRGLYADLKERFRAVARTVEKHLG
ncbi:MAG: xylulokinase [Verrucomicrobiota bacterium JB024]|nr:xylulokinase [Verrucomicrobiota bacterium JB024]